MTTAGTTGLCGENAAQGLAHRLFVDAYSGGDWSCNCDACCFRVVASACKEGI